MKCTYQLFRFFLFVVTMAILASCGTESTENAIKKEYKLNRPLEEVIVWEQGNFSNLNPIIDKMVEALYPTQTMFYTVTNYDYTTLELVPVLAKAMPEYAKNEKGELLYTYELRPEAKWENGEPITAKDLEFTLKAFKNPKVESKANRTEYELIHDVILYDDNPKKYTIVFSKTYFNALEVAGDIPIIPRYIFDPKGIMNEFTLKQLTYEADKLAENPKIIEFADMMNSEKFLNDKDILKGSGPYELEEWVSGQKVVLKRKEKWWGDALQGQNTYFDAFPKKIVHQIINDRAAALTALKAQNLDLMRAITPKDFVELQKNEKFKENYNLYTPSQIAWSYLSINTRLPKFSDKKTRQALAHLADIDKMIETVLYGFAERAIGPIRPDQKEIFNASIQPYNYNLETARKLLSEAGWKDSNGDGVVDKLIKGKKVELTINIDFPQGNDMRKNVCLLFQEEARKVGVKVEVRGIEQVNFRDNLKKADYEMAYGGWQGSIKLADLRQLFHSDNANGGSNYEGFNNAECDAILDSIRVEMDQKKVVPLFMRFQEILHEEAAHLFLFVPKERIAIHKRFGDIYTSPLKPGYWVPGFRLQD